MIPTTPRPKHRPIEILKELAGDDFKLGSIVADIEYLMRIARDTPVSDDRWARELRGAVQRLETYR